MLKSPQAGRSLTNRSDSEHTRRTAYGDLRAAASQHDAGEKCSAMLKYRHLRPPAEPLID